MRLVRLGHLILTAMLCKFCDFSTITSLWIILGPFVVVVVFEGYILSPNMVGALPGSTLPKDTIQTKRKVESECQHSLTLNT